MAADTLWPRVRWMEAVWSSDLKPMQRLVAAVYADHAAQERVVWVTLDRLCERTGMSRDAANRALRALVEKGWLATVEKGRQHRATRYMLAIPSSTSGVPLSSTPDVPLSQSSSTSPDTSSTSPDTSSTGDVLDPSSDQYSIPLPPRTKTFADIVGWAHHDERLRHVEAFLNAKGVKSARAWLTACHRNGELEPNYLAFIQEQETIRLRAVDPYYARMSSNEDWANAGREEAFFRRLAQIKACPDCDSGGFISITDSTVAKCDHPTITKDAS